MTDADKLERIRSIVADHDAYGMSSHHEMVLDITDVLAEKAAEPDLFAPERMMADLAERGRLAIQLLEMALALPDEVLHTPITHAEKLYPLCDHIQRYQRVVRKGP